MVHRLKLQNVVSVLSTLTQEVAQI